jgi:hypothetical protein
MRSFLARIALAASLAAVGFAQTTRWVLPIPDGGGVIPSPPSVHGFIVSRTSSTISVNEDAGSLATKRVSKVELRPRTQFFSAYGGPYDVDDLAAGQYVWVWYVTADPKASGTPPKAAVVMLWSSDPADKPTAKMRDWYRPPHSR